LSLTPELGKRGRFAKVSRFRIGLTVCDNIFEGEKCAGFGKMLQLLNFLTHGMILDEVIQLG